MRLTQRALGDLREIADYSVREWGQKTADSYLADISAALDIIRNRPEALRREPDLASRLYFYRVRKHYLVCDVSGSVIHVLAIIHTSMDLPTRLIELEPRLIADTQMIEEVLRNKRRSSE